MKILVTNDDGIDSEGIHELARALDGTGHQVLVVAPSSDWSGAGAALGNLRPDAALGLARATIPGAPDIEAWALDGPPALCLVAGRLGAFGELPDLVVSGINAGVNTGRSILHSGTVGAALAGQNFGISGLAVSVDAGDRALLERSGWRWDTAAQIAVETLPLLIDAPVGSVLNLNVPALNRDQVHGIRWTHLAPFGAVRATISANDGESLQWELTPTGYSAPDDTDQGAVDRGWASLTALVGIAESWPSPPQGTAAGEPGEAAGTVGIEARAVPGATLHPVHQVPGGSLAGTLIRPNLGDPPL
jgi:5'-nucleotidase